VVSRNRADGWQHAKISGHKNELNIENLLKTESFFSSFSKRIGKANISAKISIGGIKEKNVDSILGDTTKSKTDLKISYNDNSTFNISIKKSLGGQVYLIKASRFIIGYEKLFNSTIPNNIKEAILLFWGEHSEIDNYIKNYGEKNIKSIKDYENRKQRLVANSLKNYSNKLYLDLLNWFKQNIDKITKFCFSTGLSASESEYAEYVWYYNTVGENEVDKLIKIEDIINNIKKHTDQIYYGSKNGGTTINLPFGFVQWHQNSMQFHHSFDKIYKVCKGYFI